MLLNKKTIEELEEMLYKAEDEQEDSNTGFSKIISIHEVLHQKYVKRAKQTGLPADKDIARYSQKKLISELINYGTYLKMNTEKREQDAEKTLRKALRYDPGNPIANYRLGFLSYKQRDYKKAADYFDTALVSGGDTSEHSLTDRQRFQAHMYLVNAYLLKAEAASKQMLKLAEEEDMDYEPLPAYEMSRLYDYVEDQEALLNAQAFVKYTPEGETGCSKEHCEDIFNGFENNMSLILYISDHECKIRFEDSEDTISISQARDLKKFLLNSSAEEQLTAKTFESFSDSVINVVSDDAFSQRVRRLNRKLERLSVPRLIANEKRRDEERRRYYYNGQVPYIIMNRMTEDNS